MRRTPSLMLLLAVLGCAGETDSPPVVSENPGQATETGASTAELSVRPIEPPLAYPEKAEVERLLVQASELESQGKFAEALAVATQAAYIDPSSPTANEAKARLEELLRRIREPARIDGHDDSPAIVQRTTP